MQETLHHSPATVLEGRLSGKGKDMGFLYHFTRFIGALVVFIGGVYILAVIIGHL